MFIVKRNEKKMERQLKTDIQNTIQPTTNQIVIGTIIHSQDPIVKLMENPVWVGKKYPAIEKWPERTDLWNKWEQIWTDPTIQKDEKKKNADEFYKKNKKEMNKGAKVLWPEREPLQWLMKHRIDIGKRAFDAEKLMKAYLTGTSLFTNIFWFTPETVNGRYGFRIHTNKKFIPVDSTRFHSYYSCDPATSDKKLRQSHTTKKKLSDSARIIALRDMHTGCVYIHHAKMDRPPPTELIYEMYDLHAQHQFVRMGFEENLFREAFRDCMKLIKREIKSKTGEDLHLPIYSIWAETKKDLRIYACEPDIVFGKILFSTHIPQNCKDQLIDYPNVDHVDFLDAVEIMRQITNPRNRLKRMNWEEIRA